MKVMINRLVFIIILISLISCRKSISKDIVLNYNDGDSQANIRFSQYKRMKGDWGDSFFFYGVIECNFLPDTQTRLQFYLKYDSSFYKIYPDIFYDVINWNACLGGEQKMYVVFKDSEIDWNRVGIVVKKWKKSEINNEEFSID